MSTAIKITPLTPALGAEISGVDVSRIDDADFARIHRAWLEFKVVFLPHQTISLDQLEQFSRRFGKLMQLPYIKPVDGHPDIIQVLKEADEINMGVFGGDWHSDFSFLAAPPKASILFAEQLPPLGGDTLWADLSKALEHLDPKLIKQLDGKSAMHTGAPYGVANAPPESTQFKGSIEIERNNPEADNETAHPAICRHPDTNKKMLFINPTYTTRIDGMSNSASKTLLDTLFQHCQRPEFSCRFKWKQNTITIWDNRNTNHYAVNDYDGYRRCLYRTTIKGHAPFPG
ncbi:MAG: taurine dioxygenase [Planctomycetota bacterium]|jgi:taurine dioxygenase